jgi:hypothetical protein
VPSVKIDFYHQHETKQIKRSRDHPPTLADIEEDHLDSPHKVGSISPLRRHQRSINTFLDTMKQQYQQHPYSYLPSTSSTSLRHQHQLDLFENLEKELKSIIDVFSIERQQKQ